MYIFVSIIPNNEVDNDSTCYILWISMNSISAASDVPQGSNLKALL